MVMANAVCVRTPAKESISIFYLCRLCCHIENVTSVNHLPNTGNSLFKMHLDHLTKIELLKLVRTQF